MLHPHATERQRIAPKMEHNMRFSAPKSITFLVSLALAVIGVLPHFDVSVPYSEWAFVAAYVVLAAGVIFKEI